MTPRTHSTAASAEIAAPGPDERGFIRGPAAILLVALLLGSCGVAAANLLFRGGCTNGNDFAAIATLRNLSSCQTQFQEAGSVDLDGDGAGEFGFFAELTAAQGLRADARGARRGPPLRVALLSPSLAGVDAEGRVTKAGYCFRILLPGARCPSATEAASASSGSPRLRGVVDTDGAERGWLAVAWPVSAGVSGVRCLLVTHEGTVYEFDNADFRFGGTSEPTTAALPSGWRFGDALPATFTGRDGTRWSETR